MDESDVLSFMEYLKQFGAEEQNAFKSIKERIASVYELRKDVLGIIDLSRQCRKTKNPFLFKTLRKQSKKLADKLKRTYSPVIELAEITQCAEKRTSVIKAEENLLKKEFVELISAGSKERMPEEAKKAFIGFAERFRKELKLDFEGQSMAENLGAKLQLFRTIILNEQKILDEELIVLSIFSSAVPEDIDVLEQNEERLRVLHSSLNEEMYREKNEALIFLERYVKTREKIDEKIKELLAKKAPAIWKRIFGSEKISIARVKKDLRTLTTPEEIMDYVGALLHHKEMLEDKCYEFILRIGEKSRGLQKREKEILKQKSNLAVIDSLTGAFSRNFMNLKLSEIIADQMSRGGCIGLLMMDVDNFKSINDSYGHQTGDRVLAFVASIIKRSVKATDMVFRYGGEEFLVVLLSPSAFDINSPAERIRSSIEKASADFVQRMKDEKKLPEDALLKKITATIGTAGFQREARSATQEEVKSIEKKLIMAADEALYMGKKAGKNRVVNTELFTI